MSTPAPAATPAPLTDAWLEELERSVFVAGISNPGPRYMGPEGAARWALPSLLAEVRRARAAPAPAGVVAVLAEALQMHMEWIGAPPAGPHDYDSLREDAWKKGKAALALVSPAAAPVPGTATREEFERLVGALAWAAYREANPYVPDGSAKTNAARDALLRYEERLRGTLAEVIRQADSDTQVRLWTGKCQVAEARAEEATARVERLEEALRGLWDNTGTLMAELANREQATHYPLATTMLVVEESRQKAEAAFGVTTSAADADGGNHDGT